MIAAFDVRYLADGRASAAAGTDPAAAAEKIRAMHGPHRVPALLKRVDLLARGAV